MSTLREAASCRDKASKLHPDLCNAHCLVGNQTGQSTHLGPDALAYEVGALRKALLRLLASSL